MPGIQRIFTGRGIVGNRRLAVQFFSGHIDVAGPLERVHRLPFEGISPCFTRRTGHLGPQVTRAGIAFKSAVGRIQQQGGGHSLAVFAVGKFVNTGVLVRAVNVSGGSFGIDDPVSGFRVAGERDVVSFDTVPVLDGVDAGFRIEGDRGRAQFFTAECSDRFRGPGFFRVGYRHERRFRRRLRGSVLAIIQVVAGPVAVRVEHPGLGVSAGLVSFERTAGVIGVEPAVGSAGAADAVGQADGHVAVRTAGIGGGLIIVDQPFVLVGEGENDIHADDAAPCLDDIRLEGLVISENGLVGLVHLVVPVPVDRSRVRPGEIVLLRSGCGDLAHQVVGGGIGPGVHALGNRLDTDGVGCCRLEGFHRDGGRGSETLCDDIMEAVLNDVLVLTGFRNGRPHKRNRPEIRFILKSTRLGERRQLHFLLVAGREGQEGGCNGKRAGDFIECFHNQVQSIPGLQ